MLISRSRFAGFAAALILGITSAAVYSQATPVGTTSNSTDPKTQADIVKALKDKRFKGVTVAVNEDETTLGGVVATESDRADAENIARSRRNVSVLTNEIRIQGANATDAELQQKLAARLAADRIGYGTTAFNAITLTVNNGTVTLGGTVYGPDDKASAMDTAKHFPGVRGVVDNIQVAPVSNFDDQTRLAVYKAIYGFPSMQKYAVVPEKPIRIVVVNGNVTLYGVVDNQADKDTAGIRANGVANVFKVTNDLQVAGSPETLQK